MKQLGVYYRLAKPGIIRGNLLAACAGFLLASQGVVEWWRLVALLAGTGLVIGAACVLNNIIDRGIDKKMKRTRGRALVTGEVSVVNAAIFAVVLAIAGFYILALYTTMLTVGLGVLATVMYVVVYGAAKRASVHGTLIGSIPGALPPVGGYVAVTDRIDLTAVLLFAVLVAWQMPHFYAIALFRKKEYAAARLPVISVSQGNLSAKRQIIGYIILFVVASMLLGILGTAGIVYTIGVGAVGVWWLWSAKDGLTTKQDEAWAQRLFKVSLRVLLVFCVLVSVDGWLP